MATSRNDRNQETRNQDQRKQNESHEKGKQGFASMPKEQVREIAAEGGRHSHDNTNATKKK